MNVVRDWFRRQISNPQVVILAALLIIGFLVIVFLGRMLAPIFAALVLAYLLEGPIGRMEKFGIPRLPALLLVFLIFMAFLVGVFFWLLPLLYQQVAQLVQQFPEMLERGREELSRLPEQHPKLVSQEQVDEIMDAMRLELSKAQRIVSISVRGVTWLIYFAIYLVLVPLVVFFFLKDKSLILTWMGRFLPEERTLSIKVWREVDQQIGNYVQGKFLEILIVWAVTYVTFVLLKVPYAMLLAVFTGLSVLVPYIGAIAMALPVALIEYFAYGWGTHFIWVLTAYTIIQTLDGNLLAPILLSEVTNLHPIAVIVAVLVFGGIWGFWGLFFAIPLATLVHAVINAWPRGSKGELTEASGI